MFYCFIIVNSDVLAVYRRTLKRTPKDSEKEKDFDIQDSNRYGAYYVCTFTHQQSLIDFYLYKYMSVKTLSI